MSAGRAAGTFAELVRRRALARVLPALGPRRVLVLGAGDPPGEDGAPRAAAVVRVGGTLRPGDVQGAVERLPVQSESATGVLFHGVVPADAALRETVRLLQPGGCLVVTGESVAGAVTAVAEAAARAGLTTVLRRAILRPAAVAGRGAPRAFAGFAASREMRAAARVAEDETVEWVFAARLPGGVEADFPDARGILASMFVPARWRGRGEETPRDRS